MAKKITYSAPTVAEYKKMTKAQKRVAIAKDIIASINSKKYIANASTYIDNVEIDGKSVDVRYDYLDDKDIEELDIQETLPRMEKCKVCAMGACILSLTKYENKLTFADIGPNISEFSETTDKLLKGVFTPDQLAMIEIMFEGYYSDVEYDHEDYKQRGNNYSRDRLGAIVSDEDALKCIKWHWKKKKRGITDDNLMIAIWKNIVDNEGELVL